MSWRKRGMAPEFIILLQIGSCFGIPDTTWIEKTKIFGLVSKMRRDGISLLRDLNHSRESFHEEFNFHGRQLTLLGYEDDKILEFRDDNRTVTGFSGDIWTILADFLNYSMAVSQDEKMTITYMRSKADTRIIMEEMGLLVGHCPLNNYQGFDVTDEFFRQGFRIFVRSDRHFKSRWVMDIYSPKLWCVVFAMIILLSTSSILIGGRSLGNFSGKTRISSSDHIFYCFGAICNQGQDLTAIHTNNRMFSSCVCILSWLLIASYSSQIFVVITKTIDSPPFHDIEGLYYGSDYIITNNVKSIYLYWLRGEEPIVGKLLDEERYKNFDSYRDVWDFACLEKHKAAVMQNDRLRVDDDVPCELKPVGKRYRFRRIGGGIPKNITFKKIINYGINKLREVGITSYLKSKWMRSKEPAPLTTTYSPIVFEQVSLLVGIYLIGFCLSIVILVYECRQIRKKKGARM